MYYKKKNKHKHIVLFPSGFGLIELVVVLGLTALMVPSMLQFSFFVTKVMGEQQRKVEAAYLAEEGIEAVRTMRDSSWTDAIVPLSLATSYYPVLVGDSWTLNASDPGVLLGRYTLTITLDAVSRDASSNIVAPPAVGGMNDDGTRLVTSTITWNDEGTPSSFSVQAYVTDFLSN
ncbi:hypothetical protein COV04_00495 [Candidatus Uhrbacteria bacterium CG10_big_fil_rev_8_21_14_0_10_48_11]|uniref:Uncharacterized protein n=1 Tax=Candidatus Uhrbacteria bacterium CG10_big_fil_rev_8_21_14_0_10_48_11 TaxID=1975037 RepID=A0A2M8LFK8_9BACT|nr:MAG: hypothetical protein COV04_00495 [Candidatus Uhrbacteria bacterium CG10_big_fil_rev_8_21_14_0_10_48_11]